MPARSATASIASAKLPVGAYRAYGPRPSAPIQATLADSGTAVTLDIEPIRAMLREEIDAALARSQGQPGNAQAQQVPMQAPASTLSVQQLVQAINNGSLKVSTNGPPL